MRNLTPEEDDILRHHPASPAADKIRAERARAEWGERAAAEQAKQGADLAARDMRIAELERDLADKGASLKTAHDALTRICEVIGAPAPVAPADAVSAVETLLGASEHAEARAREMEATMREIGLALADAGAPQTYHLEDDAERPIPDPERIRLLGERARAEHAERIREGDRAELYRRRLADTDRALDDAGAPRLADGAPLSVAARVRGLKA